MSKRLLNDVECARLLACNPDNAIELYVLAREFRTTAPYLMRQRGLLEASGWLKERVCMFGLTSRWDFPADGFRAGLIELAARDLAKTDVRFVVLAGGMFDGRGILKQSREHRRRIREAKRRLNQLLNKAGDFIGDDDERDEAEGLLADIDRFQSYLDEFLPENLAAKLAELMPVFRNKSGEVINLYVVPSPVYDGQVGEDAARKLAELRSDVRVYRTGGDRLKIGRYGSVYVLVPTKTAWRSDFYSTPVQRLLKDFANRSAEKLPDLFVIGGFGSTLSKPEGEAVRPYVSAPALCVLGSDAANENQIGIRIVTMTRGEVDPETLNLSYKDRIMNEGEAIKLPKGLSPVRRQIVEAIMANGDPMTVGWLADATGISRDVLKANLEAMKNKPGKRPLNWPGLRYYGSSRRWGLDAYWMRENLTYPDLPDNVKVDSIVAIGCPHTGSVFTDIPFQIKYVTKALLERDATVLALVGDLIEGLKHGLAIKGEVIGGMNNNAQEDLAGRIYAKIILEVAIARLEKLLAARGLRADQITADELRAFMHEAIVQVLIIAGNHDEWVQEMGFTPLVTLKKVWAREVFRGLCEYLASKNLYLPGLYDFVESKIVEPVDGKATLPSGLRVDLLHPHMGRSATHSGKPQDGLSYSRDCQCVLEANFHVGLFVQTWDAILGERFCLELGTLKRGTSFEHRKLKTVDFGFGAVTVYSLDGRIVATVNRFYSALPTEDSCTDPMLAYNAVRNMHGI